MAIYLVTGGAGFIGSHISRALVRRGDTVRVLDNLSSGSLEYVQDIADRISFIEGDIGDAATLSKACAGVDSVIHQAAVRAVGLSIDNPLASHEVNATGTLKLLLAAKEQRVQRVIFASSSAVYGDAYTARQAEDMPPVPRSPYAVTKLMGEYYGRLFSDLYHLDTVSLRYFNVYGPGQNPESQYSLVIPLFIDQLMRGNAPEIHGQGKQARDFIYIDDVVQAVLLAADRERPLGGAVYNVGSGKQTSILDLYTLLQHLLGTNSPAHFGAARAGDVRSTYADTIKTEKGLAFTAQVALVEGLKRTMAWYKQHSTTLSL